MRTKNIFFCAVLICLFCISIYFIEKESKGSANLTPSFLTDDDGLYVHAKSGKEGSDAWQKWGAYNGSNSTPNIRYFFIPISADDEFVEIYNNYKESVDISGLEIKPKTSAIVNYTEGEELTATKANQSYKFTIYKSGAEVSVFINDSTGVYKDYKGNDVETDFYSFLIRNKNNSVKDSKCIIVDKNGINETALKKIKGRGNSSWKGLSKKPFNITFYEQTLIGHTKSKKFSFISTTCDPTMLRNKFIFDLSDEVGLQYSPDISFADVYINGIYRGCYEVCEKVDMGKNSLVALEDNSDKKDSDFNFLVEVDVWNYSGDTNFTTHNGYHIVLKTPNLNDYNENDFSMKAKYDYIKNTYQKFEDAMYKGTLEELEKVCDINSLATMYLMQEFGKNCDGGFTSTYFTYNADEKKFYAVPIWDCDTMFGTIDLVKEGYTSSTSNTEGWLTRVAKYEGIINPLGQPFYISGKTSEGKTYEEICMDIWSEKFMPAINILLGNNISDGRLKSIDEYVQYYEKAIYNNYIMWNMNRFYSSNFRWNKLYTKDYSGDTEYLKDWIINRAEWINTAFFS